jgi:hypothetical protein
MRKTLSALLLLGLPLTACSAPNGTAGSTSGTTIDTKKRASEDDLPGVVMARLGDDEGLMILPFEDAPAYNRLASRTQIRACPMDARYPDCLP